MTHEEVPDVTRSCTPNHSSISGEDCHNPNEIIPLFRPAEVGPLSCLTGARVQNSD